MIRALPDLKEKHPDFRSKSTLSLKRQVTTNPHEDTLLSAKPQKLRRKH